MLLCLSNSQVQTSVLGPWDDFVFSLSQQQEQQQEEPPTKYLSCYWPNFDQTLNMGFWEHLEQIPTVTVKFVLATLVLLTFVYIRDKSAVTDPNSTKLLGPNFLGALFFVGHHSFWRKLLLTRRFFPQNVFLPNIFHFFYTVILLSQICLPKFVLYSKFLNPKYFCT